MKAAHLAGQLVDLLVVLRVGQWADLKAVLRADLRAEQKVA